MKSKLGKLALAAGFGLAFIFTFSCSNEDDSGHQAVKKDKVTGISQKGPFVKGSAITLSELNDKLVQTGRSFREIITDDKGSFEINIELDSYAMFEANGYYRNEVTGLVSKSPINLYAIANLNEKSSVNVNILTHLEHYRVKKLLGDGKSLKDAKKQAQKEILAVFGISEDFKDSEDMSIFGATDGDAALLAISILLQGDLSEGQFTERLTDFSIGFRETGVWDNKTEKDKIADWAAEADLESIRKHILDWKLSSSVPNFEKYIRAYWYENYGFGPCTDAMQGNVSNKGTDYYTCDNKVWRKATYKEKKCSVSECLTFTDSRDGKSYVYVEIGRQTWMAENLNYNATDSKCYKDNDYPNEAANCATYGRLYDWNTATTACPSGWHLPSDADWNVLMKSINANCADNSDCAGAGTKLKATSDWNSNGNGTDYYGFSALPGGGGNPDGYFHLIGKFGTWWSSSDYSSTGAYYRYMVYESESVYYYDTGFKGSLLSVRCVKN